MEKRTQLWKCLLTAVVLVVMCVTNVMAYDVSGTVTYSGGKSGRVYVTLHGNGQYGTSIAGSGAFTIHGVQNGTYTVDAFMDVQNTGTAHATDPSGYYTTQTGPTITVSNSNFALGSSLTINDPVSVSQPATPSGFKVLPADNAALVMWGSSWTGVAEDADSYDLYWGTSPDPGPATTSTGSILGIPAAGDHTVILTNQSQASIANGSQLYFSIFANKAGQPQSVPATTTSITIGNPITSVTTVNGAITYSGSGLPANTPTLVALVDATNGSPTQFYVGRIAATAVGNNAYTITNVPNGSYELHAIIDLNNNNIIDIGDLTSSGKVMVTVNGATVSNANTAIIESNVVSELKTFNVGGNYAIECNINGMKKRPVTVTLTSGSGIVEQVDFGQSQSGGFYGKANIGASAPAVGSFYLFNVLYQDLTSETVTSAVTGVVTSAATLVTPSGLQPFAANQLFSWTAPSSPPSGQWYYTLFLALQGGNTWLESVAIPNSQTSGTFDALFPGHPGLLAINTPYTWAVHVNDIYGNAAANYSNFSFGTPSSLAITTSSLPNGTVGTVYSQPISYIGGTPPYTVGYTGNLPPGVPLGTDGLFSGNPTTAGTYSFTVNVTDSTSTTVSQPYTVVIGTGGSSPALSIVTTNLPAAAATFTYSQQIQVAGGTPPYTFSIATGTLPGGVVLSSNGYLSGTVSNLATGNNIFTVQVTDSASATAQATLNITVDVASPTISSAGVYHGTMSSGVEADFLDMVIKNVTALSPTTGVTATVTGPNGFNYSFTNADIKPFINGQIDLNYQMPVALAPGVYTFTLDDGVGHVSKRVDTHGGVATVPLVDSTKIQIQRKSDGSYRINWAPLNDIKTYNYRIRINDGTGAPVYISNRTMQGYDDVPASSLVVGTTYQVRAEASESATFDMMTNRSSSSYVSFIPQVSDNSGMLLYSYAGAFNQVETDGTQGASFGFAACNSSGTACSASDASLVTLAEIYAPDGTLYYTYDMAADKQSNGVDFLHFFNPAPASGTYKIRYVANGLDHYSYVTLTPPVVYPAPDNSTYQAIEQANGNIRFSWANVDYNGALYYRIQIKDMVTGTYYTTGRFNQTIIDVPKSTLGSVFGNSTNVKWRVEVYDSSNYNTQRNRRNGSWSVGVLSDTPSYSVALPTIGNYGIANSVPSNGIASTEIWFAASSTSATITELRVEGPNGFVRNMMTQATNVGNGQYRLYESGSLQSGLYKFTAFDSNGINSYRYDYLTSPHALPVVDMKTMQATTDPNGDIRFSWAPVISDITTWCNLLVFANTDIYGSGSPDLLVTSSLIQASSVTFTAATLAQPQLMLRVQCNDGSNTMVYNNRSRSMMVGYHGAGYNYSILTDADGDGYASDVDANDNDANVYPFSIIGGATDTTPPTVPAGLTTNAISATQINVSWNSSTDNVGVTHYNVYRNGSLVAQPAGPVNTFWSDTSVAAMTTYSYAVAACDAANNCSAQSPAISVATPSGGIIVPVTFTGTVSYSGTKTGYVYVNVQTNNGTLGTAIKWTSGMTSANYTIRGVPPGNVSNTITAYLDFIDNGARTASSPAGSSSGSTSAGRNIILTAPAQVAPAAPQNVEVKPGNSSVMMMWQPNKTNNVIDADYYDVYWNTTPQVSTTNFAGQKLSVPAGLDSPIVISSLTNGSGYYFLVVPRAGTLTGTASAVTGPITIGAATGLNTVSGTVTYNGSIPANTPLIVAVVGTGSNKGLGTLFFSKMDNAASGQSFSVTGVPDGSYEVYTILDLNNDGIIGNGDVSNTSNDQAPIAVLSGGAGASMGTIALLNRNVEVSLTTDHFKSGVNEWYNLNGTIAGQLKRPVSATLMTAPAASTLFFVPMDVTIGNSNGKDIQFWGGGTQVPVVGDTYSFTINYSDGTQDLGVTAPITGVINNFPINPTISNPVSTVPTFSWSAPTVAPVGNYMYSLWVGDNNGNNMWEQWSIPNSIRSVTYGSGSSSSTALQIGTQYNWNVSVRDLKGNRASTGSNFTPSLSGAVADTTPPVITSTVPVNNATGVSINAPITITFSEAVVGLPDLTVALKNNATGLYVPGYGVSSADSKTHTFMPNVQLSPGTTYSIQFSTVTDLVGNPLPVMTLTFTTAAVADTTPPTIVTITPVNNATNVPINTVLTVKFSEAINQTTLPVETSFLKTGSSTFIPGVGSYDSVTNTGTFTPLAPLAYNTTYTGTLAGIKDLAGNVMVGSYTFTFTTAAAPLVDIIPPVTAVSIVGGVYTTAQTVALSANEAATTYYTIDGTTPSSASSVYATPLTVSTTTTLKFFSKDTAGNSEPPKTVIYIIDSSAPVTTASPAGGAYSSALSVTLSASEPATIYYTTNGSVPTAASLVYSKPIVISATTTLKFFSKDAGGNIEPVKQVQYTIDTTAPVVTVLPAGGSYTSAQSVTLSANETATIYYTLDGTVPTPASSVYSGPIAVSFTTTVNYFAQDTAGNSGLVQIADYFIDITAPALVSTAPANAATNVSISVPIILTFSEPVKDIPNATAFLKNESSGQFVTGTVTESPDKMSYTFIPSTQLVAGNSYSVQLTGVSDSAGNALPASSVTFTTKVATATDTTPPLSSASVAAGMYSSVQSVALRSNETAKIYYTTDGTTPTTASKLYSVPISISSTTTLKFFAVDTVGNVEPDINSNLYIIVPSGDVNNDGIVDIADAYRLLQISVGRIDATTADKKNGDVGPLVNGMPTPDGTIGIGDVVVLLRRIVGSVTW